MKQTILDTVKDLCSDFLYYGRKEDEELSEEQLKKALKDGVVTIDEIVAQFKETLEEKINI